MKGSFTLLISYLKLLMEGGDPKLPIPGNHNLCLTAWACFPFFHREMPSVQKICIWIILLSLLQTWYTLKSRPGPGPGPIEIANPRLLEKVKPILKFIISIKDSCFTNSSVLNSSKTITF